MSLRAPLKLHQQNLPAGAAAFQPALGASRKLARCARHLRCQASRQDASSDAAQVDRRALLSAAAAVAAAQLAAPLAAAAADESAPAADELKEFKGKAGYSFAYPASWIAGFNRNNQSGALALVGDFKTFETASVINADLARLNLSSEVAEKGDVKALARALTDEARIAGNTFSFELVNEGAKRRAGGNYIVFEYVLSICNGEIEEGLEGVRRCLGPKGDGLDPIMRHLVASATFKDGRAYLLTASAPVGRWEQAAPQLRAVAESFQLDSA